jgi:sporulation protein YlmC with PRC-barrel domain
MEREHRSDRFTAIEDQYSGYEVYDRTGEKIGKVDDLFVDENDRAEYIGVKMGFLGTSSTLIPWELARVDEQGRHIEVSVEKDQAKEGPSFNDDEDNNARVRERGS